MTRSRADDSATVGTPNGGRARRCTATSKRAGRRCLNPALIGRNKCSKHCGTSVDGSSHAGPNNPNWRGGISLPRYSGPPILNERLAAAMRDPELLTLHAEVALITARLQELVALLAGDVDPAGFSDVSSQLLAAVDAGDDAAQRAALAQLAEIRSSTRASDGTWSRIMRMVERRRKLVDTASRREQLLNLHLSLKDATLHGQALMTAVTRHVRDVNMLRAITDEIQAIIGPEVQP
jgi:hypothetical protein